jgi:antitoxin component YwqK of YwqJK toxin-antitoxin module
LPTGRILEVTFGEKQPEPEEDEEVKQDDGFTYEGEKKDGLRDGEGTLFDRNMLVLYKGNWKNNLQNGHGTSYNPEPNLCGTAIDYANFNSLE